MMFLSSLKGDIVKYAKKPSVRNNTLKITQEIKVGTSPHWSRYSVGSNRYSINKVRVGSKYFLKHIIYAENTRNLT